MIRSLLSNAKVLAVGGIAAAAFFGLWQMERGNRAEDRVIFVEALAREQALRSANDDHMRTIAAIRADFARQQALNEELEKKYAKHKRDTAEDIRRITADQARHRRLAAKKPSLIGRLHDRATLNSLQRLSKATCRANCSYGDRRKDLPDTAAPTPNPNTGN